MTTSRRQTRSESVGSDWPERAVNPGHAARDSARVSVQPEQRPNTTAIWNISEVSTYLQIPISSIYKMTARNAAVRIPHIRIGGKLRFRQSDVDRWLTLLTVSNIETLSRIHQKVSKVIHGSDSQAQAG